MSFISREPRLDEYWRAIVLFGRNVASYKFALAQSLLELNPVSGQLVSLEELAPVYAKYISEHLASADRQSTAPNSKFLSVCREYNLGNLTKEQLSTKTLELGFKNVVDAFHVVGSKETEKRFFADERRSSKGLRITDEFDKLVSGVQGVSLRSEVEARWRLVETAWSLGMSRKLISIHYDPDVEALFTADKGLGRTTVTGSREALNGYQKGRCFYCFNAIDLNGNGTRYPDVDHFFPHVLKKTGLKLNVDGVWNLVLACSQCNRGIGGKSASVPTMKLLERLHRRNEFLISSHHPLSETIARQSGQSTRQRVQFLNAVHSDATGYLLNTWEPTEVDHPYF